MTLSRSSQQNQRGDTLVEVVMAIALLASVLAAAYSAANLSYQIGKQARERTQAAHVLQDQSEKLRRYRDQAAKAQISNPVANIIRSQFGPPYGSLVNVPAIPGSQAPATPGTIPNGLVMFLDSSGNIQPFRGVATNNSPSSHPELCFGLPQCQIATYVSVFPQAPASPLLVKADMTVYVRWRSSVLDTYDEMSVGYTLTDSRPLPQSICDNSLAGSCP